MIGDLNRTCDDRWALEAPTECIYPPPPRDFDPLTATVKDLKRHGLPLRPAPQTQPGLATLWGRLK